MTNHPTKKTTYLDLIGNEHNTEQEASQANHHISLKVRHYLENLLVTFSDGGIDKLKTTLHLWSQVEFTQEFIKSCCVGDKPLV